MFNRQTLILCIALLLGGCASVTQLYEGPRRPADAVALIKIERRYLLGTDGNSEQNFTGRLTRLNGSEIDAEAIEVLPGPMKLCVEYHRRSENLFTDVAFESTTQGHVSFEAEPGETYLVSHGGAAVFEVGTDNGDIVASTSSGEILDRSRRVFDEIPDFRWDLEDPNLELFQTRASCNEWWLSFNKPAANPLRAPGTISITARLPGHDGLPSFQSYVEEQNAPRRFAHEGEVWKPVAQAANWRSFSTEVRRAETGEWRYGGVRIIIQEPERYLCISQYFDEAMTDAELATWQQRTAWLH